MPAEAAPDLALAGPPRRRRARARAPGMTALIDIVFILLIFFMLAAKLGVERTLALDATGGGGGAVGALLLEVTPTGGRIAGAAFDDAGLRATLAVRLAAAPDLRVLVAPKQGADAARVVAALDMLAALGAREAALMAVGGED